MPLCKTFCASASAGSRSQGRGGDRPRHQFFRGIDNTPMAPATRDALDPPACGALAAGIDPRHFHGQRIGPAGMAIDALQIDRAIGHRAIQFGRGRKAPEAPFLLVPAAPEDPRTGFVFSSEGTDLVERFLERIGVRQVERQRADTDPHDMGMRIDQPGDHHRASPRGNRSAVPGRARSGPVQSCRHRRSPAQERSPPSSPIVSPSTLSISTSAAAGEARASARVEARNLNDMAGSPVAICRRVR